MRPPSVSLIFRAVALRASVALASSKASAAASSEPGFAFPDVFCSWIRARALALARALAFALAFALFSSGRSDMVVSLFIFHKISESIKNACSAASCRLRMRPRGFGGMRRTRMFDSSANAK